MKRDAIRGPACLQTSSTSTDRVIAPANRALDGPSPIVDRLRRSLASLACALAVHPRVASLLAAAFGLYAAAGLGDNAAMSLCPRRNPAQQHRPLVATWSYLRAAGTLPVVDTASRDATSGSAHG